MYAPEVINPCFAEVGEHKAPRFAVTFSDEVTAKLPSLPQTILCGVSIQTTMVPSAERKDLLK